FEAHAGECETCAAELQSARELEQKMSSLFAATVPNENFENRLIARLRESAPRLRIHPAIRKAAVAAAAVILLGGVGYVANQKINSGSPPVIGFSDRVKVASNLRQINQAIALYTNESKGAYQRTVSSLPGAAGPSWSTGSVGWSDPYVNENNHDED